MAAQRVAVKLSIAARGEDPEQLDVVVAALREITEAHG